VRPVPVGACIGGPIAVAEKGRECGCWGRGWWDKAVKEEEAKGSEGGTLRG